MKKKSQHIIPKCYLRAWADPDCPSSQEPYLWLFSADGKEKKKKSPQKTFVETEMYTIKLPDGRRELIIEDTLSHIETSFVKVTKNKIKKSLSLDNEERTKLCIFTAAMFSRTKSQQENIKKFFGEIHNHVEFLEKQHNAAPRTSLETKIMRDCAHQIHISESLEIMSSILYKMSLAILKTDDKTGFITSDHPCVLFNPEGYKLPPLYRSPGLGNPKIEVTLPLTPNHLLFFSWSKSKGYLPIEIEMVDELNRRTRAYCEEYFVSRKSETKLIWFEIGEMPKDAWEKVHGEN